jgi:hypothetical protein
MSELRVNKGTKLDLEVSGLGGKEKNIDDI